MKKEAEPDSVAFASEMANSLLFAHAIKSEELEGVKELLATWLTKWSEQTRRAADSVQWPNEEQSAALLSQNSALSAEVKELREALEKIEQGLCCRGEQDQDHYCPNCDNSLFNCHAVARAALNHQNTPRGNDSL